MKRIFKISAWVAAAALLFGCGSTNGNSFLPSQTSTNLSNVGKLQFAVGTAHLADGTTGLNVVSTFRQSNGLSATLVNTPMIQGPSGFAVPNPVPVPSPNGYGGPGVDAGTSSITSTPQNATSPSPTTFGVTGGVFASGIEPFNTVPGATAFYPGSPPSNAPSPSYGEPFYTTKYDNNGTAPQPFLLGPPSVPFFNDGTYPGGFAGYQTGFNAFEAAPVTGQYTLSVLVSAINVKSVTYTATATLSSTSVLPALPQPGFTEDGKGGGTATVVVPPGLTETIVYVVDTTAGLYFSSGPLKGSGTLSFVLPDTLGVCSVKVTGCQNNASQSAPSMSTGDTYLVYAAGFDYSQFEAEPPGNRQQLPTISGANGQADVTLSPAFSSTY
jgi:hypothetical protein